MVVFALVNNTPDGGYYIASSVSNMGWRGLPHDLADEMEDVRKKGEEVLHVSIGLDGDWFLRTKARHSCKEVHVSQEMTSNVEIFLHLAESGGLDLSQYVIQFFTFVPDPTGYVCVLHKYDGALSRCAWRNVPPDLDACLEREANVGVRHVAVGIGGAYVIILNTGVVWWSGVPEALGSLLDTAERIGRPVRTVSLSLTAASWYYIEFADGDVDYNLPKSWHDSINKHTAVAAPRRHSMATAYHSPSASSSSSFPASPLDQYAALTAALNPYSSLNTNPFAAAMNPYAALGQINPYSALGQHAALNPYAVLMGGTTPGYMPQAPQYNYTNIYNQAAAPEEPESGKFQVLGGALKVAGAVLNIASGMGGFGGFDVSSFI